MKMSSVTHMISPLRYGPKADTPSPYHYPTLKVSLNRLIIPIKPFLQGAATIRGLRRMKANPN